MKQHQESLGIKDLAPGEHFIGFCVVRQKEIKYKQDGGSYLLLELGDRSGRLKAKIWDNIQEVDKLTSVGHIIKIKAVVQAFQNKRELKLLKVRKTVAGDDVHLKNFLPHSVKDIDQLKEKFYSHLSSIQNPYLKRLLSLLFKDSQFTEAYFKSPAGKLWHHNYLSGILEHVVVMLDLAQLMKHHYPLIELDLLKSGAICYNLGKVEEYSLNGYIDFSDQGRLLGYTAMGYEIVSNAIKKINEFPVELKNHLLHLMVSHEDEASDSATIAPMTLEGVVLQNMIRLDANVNALCRFVEKDALPDSPWTKYIPLLKRFIYVKKKAFQ